MRTKSLRTYGAFIKAGRPYLPVVQDGLLVLPNFAVNAHQTGPKSRNRLVITSTVFYNRCEFVALYVSSISCQGFRFRWLYFRRGRRVCWFNLSWDERNRVAAAWFRRAAYGDCEHMKPPTTKIANYYPRVERYL